MADNRYHRNRQNGHGRGGFTLIEVMVATAIMIPLLIILMRIVPGMLKVGTKVELITRATFLAEKKMEEVRGLVNSSNVSYGFSRDYTEGAAPFPAPDALYKFMVSDSSGPRIKELRVTVWRDDNGNGLVDLNEYSVSFDTKAAK